MGEATVEDVPLSRQLADREDVRALTDEALRDLFAEHQRHIVIMQGAVEANAGTDAGRRCTQILRVLRLHAGWIAQELGERAKYRRTKAHRALIARQAEAKIAVVEAERQRQREAHALKLERMAASHEENRRQFEAFKALVREAVGEDRYLQLWATARDQPAKGGSDA